MFKKIISLFLSLSLIITQPIFAQGLSRLNLAQYLGQIHPSATDIFRPTQLRYFSYDNLNNSYRILLDKGDLKDIKDNQLKEEAKELMDYFLIGLALPNDTFWVNLRPDSPDNIINPELEKTDLGRILLEADLQLKKDTASSTSPQTPEGKAYWDKLYKKAAELFGNENITIPTLTRPWIVPGEIIVRESQNSAYIYKATLKVMLEEDYLSRGRSRTAPTMRTAPTPDQYNFTDPRLKELNEYSTQIIRETIIPKIIREVNSSKKYAKLRQVYYSLVLSRWFKMRFSGKSGQYVDLIDKHDLTNLTTQEPYNKRTYFKEYQESFAQGEYNLKEPVYTPYGQSIRVYMSGGFTAEYMNFSGPEIKAETASNPAEQQLLLPLRENTVILDNNFKIVDLKQPLAIAASPLTREQREAIFDQVSKMLSVFFFNELDKKNTSDPQEKNVKDEEKTKAGEELLSQLNSSKGAILESDNALRKYLIKMIISLKENHKKYYEILKNGYGKLISTFDTLIHLSFHTTASPPPMAVKVVNILEETIKSFETLIALGPLSISNDEQMLIIAVVDSMGEELEIWDEFQPQQILKKEEFKIMLNNTIDKLKSLKDKTFRIRFILGPAIEKLQGMQQSLATVLPLINEGYVVNNADRGNISVSKVILDMFSYYGKELIKRYPDSKELYEETEKKLKTYWETEETYDIQKAAEAALEFYTAIAGIKPGGSKVEPEIESKIKILQDTGIIINGIVEKIKFLIEEDIVELGKKVNTGVVPKDLNKFSRELNLKNSKATVNYILFLLSDQFKPYRGDSYADFIKDSKTRYSNIQTELEIFDFPGSGSPLTAERYIIDDEAKEKIKNIKYALMMFPFETLEFIARIRNQELKEELQDLYQEINKRIITAKEANDIIGVSEALKEFYATAAGFQFQELSVMPEVSEKLAELDELKSIIEAVLKKMKNLIELDITAFEEVMLNKEDKEDVDFSDIESIIKELSLNNLKPAALKMKELFETHQPSGYRQYGRKWTSIITELKIFNLPGSGSPLNFEEAKGRADSIFSDMLGEAGEHAGAERLLREQNPDIGNIYSGYDVGYRIWEYYHTDIKDLQGLNDILKKVKARMDDFWNDPGINGIKEKSKAGDKSGFRMIADARERLGDLINDIGVLDTASSNLIAKQKEQPGNPSEFSGGGIDFTDKAMRIGLERMGSFADLKLVLPEIANVAALNLDSEFKQIQNMALSGIRPADNRILEFAAACYYRGEFSLRLGEITSCLQQAHFLDERLGKESSPALRLATMLPEVL